MPLAELYVAAVSAATAVSWTSLSIPAILALAAAIWSSWWIWRFVIYPRLHPDEPKDLPYLVPVLGHAAAFFRNSTELVTRGRLWFGDTREPFALTLAGSKMYVLSKPRDVGEAYRNSTTFSYDIFVQAMMRICGSSEMCIREMYLPGPDTVFPNPKLRPLAVLARDMHIHQLLPGKNLDLLGDQFYAFFASRLHLDLIGQAPAAQQKSKDGVVLSLNDWISDMFVQGGTEAYFGQELLKIDPDLVSVFLTFDDLSWQILYQYPRLLAGPMYSARDRLTASIERYFELPQTQRTGDAWFTKAMEDDMRRLGISTHDIAVMMMTIHWGINTNTRRACFWLLSYMLQDRSLLEQIREETRRVWAQDGSLDWKCLLGQCPRLEAAWNETIRLTASSASVRYVSEDTVIGGKLLRRGNRIMIPNRQLHMDETVFGLNTAQYDADRFNNDKLTRCASWRPFGGGITVCPGRFIARNSTYAFIALLLKRFEISKADESQPFPKQDTGTPVLGVMTNVPGTEFVVRLQPRVVPAAPA